MHDDWFYSVKFIIDWRRKLTASRLKAEFVKCGGGGLGHVERERVYLSGEYRPCLISQSALTHIYLCVWHLFVAGASSLNSPGWPGPRWNLCSRGSRPDGGRGPHWIDLDGAKNFLSLYATCVPLSRVLSGKLSVTPLGPINNTQTTTTFLINKNISNRPGALIPLVCLFGKEN